MLSFVNLYVQNRSWQYYIIRAPPLQFVPRSRQYRLTCLAWGSRCSFILLSGGMVTRSCPSCRSDWQQQLWSWPCPLNFSPFRWPPGISCSPWGYPKCRHCLPPGTLRVVSRQLCTRGRCRVRDWLHLFQPEPESWTRIVGQEPLCKHC